MNTCKCEVCGKTIQSDAEQFVVCDECKTVMHSDIEEVGEYNGNS